MPHPAPQLPGRGRGDPRLRQLWFTGAAKVVEQYGEGAIERVDARLREAVAEYGTGVSAVSYLDATAVRMDLGVRMGAFHNRFDLLLTPTTPIPAFPKGQDAPDGWPSTLWTSRTPYTYPFTMTQQPTLSLPCGFTAQRRPIGLQMVGPRHADPWSCGRVARTNAPPHGTPRRRASSADFR